MNARGNRDKPARPLLLYFAGWTGQAGSTPTIRRRPRRSREVGGTPTRSRHCKRGAPSQRPWTRVRRAVTGPGVWEDREWRADPRVRKPGHRERPFRGAPDAGRSTDMAHPPSTAGLPIARACVEPGTENTLRLPGHATRARPVAP